MLSRVISCDRMRSRATRCHGFSTSRGAATLARAYATKKFVSDRVYRRCNSDCKQGMNSGRSRWRGSAWHVFGDVGDLVEVARATLEQSKETDVAGHQDEMKMFEGSRRESLASIVGR